MIDRIMKRSGEKAYLRDMKRLDLSRLDPSVEEYTDISFADDDNNEHKLDVYCCKDGTVKPVLIDLHGGGFISHDKKIDRLYCNYMASQGFVVFSVNYRLAYPEYNVFDQVQDVDCAVRWVLEHAAEYEGDTGSLNIAGHSSAGVLAVTEVLLCNDEKMRADYGISPRTYKYRSIILDCGLMHFYKRSLAYWGMRRMVFPRYYKRTMKYEYMLFEKNPMLRTLPNTVLITNRRDELKDMTYYFKGLLDRSSVQNELIDEGEDGHMGIVFKPWNLVSYTQDRIPRT